MNTTTARDISLALRIVLDSWKESGRLSAELFVWSFVSRERETVINKIIESNFCVAFAYFLYVSFFFLCVWGTGGGEHLIFVRFLVPFIGYVMAERNKVFQNANHGQLRDVQFYEHENCP